MKNITQRDLTLIKYREKAIHALATRANHISIMSTLFSAYSGSKVVVAFETLKKAEYEFRSICEETEGIHLKAHRSNLTIEFPGGGYLKFISLKSDPDRILGLVFDHFSIND